MGIDRVLRRIMGSLTSENIIDFPYPDDEEEQVVIGDSNSEKRPEWQECPRHPDFIKIVYRLDKTINVTKIKGELIHNQLSCGKVKIYGKKKNVLSNITFIPMVGILSEEEKAMSWLGFCDENRVRRNHKLSFSFDVVDKDVVLRETFNEVQEWLYTPPNKINVEAFWPLGGKIEGGEFVQAYFTLKEHEMQTVVTEMPLKTLCKLKKRKELYYEHRGRRFFFPLGLKIFNLEKELASKPVQLDLGFCSYLSHSMEWHGGFGNKLIVTFKKKE